LWAGWLLYREITECKFNVTDKIWCNRIEPPLKESDLLFYINYLSKLWEVVDLWLVALMRSPIYLPFRVHHWTTIIVAWVSAKYNLSGKLPIIFLNTFHHIFMYAYFGGNRFTTYTQFFALCKFILLITGTIQLLVGILHESLIIYWRLNGKLCNGTLEAEIFCLVMYWVYFYFWGNDLYLIYTMAKEKKKEL